MARSRVRRNGQWAPLHGKYYHDEALVLAGVMAELLFVRGLAYCAESGTDGFISDIQLVRQVGVGLDGVSELADLLCSTKDPQTGETPWERVEGGYRVRKWLAWNWSQAEIEQYRKKDADRKRGDQLAFDEPPPHPPSGVRTESERSPSGGDTEVRAESGGIRAPDIDIDTDTEVETDTEKNPSARSARDLTASSFEAFYSIYPRKREPRKARKAWDQALKRGADPGRIVAAAGRYRAERADQDPIFTKYPASWLNAGAYDNQPDGPVMAEKDRTVNGWQRLRHTGTEGRVLRALPGGNDGP